MTEQKNFLLLAIGIGAAGIIIGGISIWDSVAELFLP